jgi:hypothetical protein
LWSRRHYELCKMLERSVKGFSSGECLKIACSQRKAKPYVTQCLALTHLHVIYTLFYLTFSFFVTGPIDQTIEPIFTHSGLNNTVLPKEVSFLASHLMKLPLEISVPYRLGPVKWNFMQAWFRVDL